MSCDFKVGDEVVCVRDDYGWAELDLTPPVIGQAYVVAKVWGVLHVRGEPSLRDVGIDLVGLEHSRAAYPAAAFRKVQRRDLSVWLATENTIEGPLRTKEHAR